MHPVQAARRRRRTVHARAALNRARRLYPQGIVAVLRTLNAQRRLPSATEAAHLALLVQRAVSQHRVELAPLAAHQVALGFTALLRSPSRTDAVFPMRRVDLRASLAEDIRAMQRQFLERYSVRLTP